MLNVTPLEAREDNYIWVLSYTNSDTVFLIDPGAIPPLDPILHNHTVGGIFITHHHADHVAALPFLKERLPNIPVYGPSTLPETTQPAQEGSLFYCRFQCKTTASEATVIPVQTLWVPGHTQDHLAWYLPGYAMLFCGDTLFSAGCGRLFEGSFQDLYLSLQKIAALPDNTQLYPTHEYTENNIEFARWIEPDNAVLLEYQHHIKARRLQGEPSLPSTLATEKKINPFLRCHVRAIQTSVCEKTDLSLYDCTPLQVFSELRKLKDAF